MYLKQLFFYTNNVDDVSWYFPSGTLHKHNLVALPKVYILNPRFNFWMKHPCSSSSIIEGCQHEHFRTSSCNRICGPPKRSRGGDEKESWFLIVSFPLRVPGQRNVNGFTTSSRPGNQPPRSNQFVKNSSQSLLSNRKSSDGRCWSHPRTSIHFQTSLTWRPPCCGVTQTVRVTNAQIHGGRASNSTWQGYSIRSHDNIVTLLGLCWQRDGDKDGRSDVL